MSTDATMASPGEDSRGFLAGGWPWLARPLPPPDTCFIFGTAFSSFSELAWDKPLMRSSSAAARKFWRSSWLTLTCRNIFSTDIKNIIFYNKILYLSMIHEIEDSYHIGETNSDNEKYFRYNSKNWKCFNVILPPKEDHWLRMRVFLQHYPEERAASREHQLVRAHNVAIAHLQ